MLRNLGATFVGLLLGNIFNMALITLNTVVLFPMPPDTDMTDPASFGAYTASLPTAAFLVVILAHVGQAGFGGGVAARLAASRPRVVAGILGGLTFLGAAYNLTVIPSPSWMWAELPIIAAVTWAVGEVEARRRASQPARPPSA